jgi:hypothetical protein
MNIKRSCTTTSRFQKLLRIVNATCQFLALVLKKVSGVVSVVERDHVYLITSSGKRLVTTRPILPKRLLASNRVPRLFPSRNLLAKWKIHLAKQPKLMVLRKVNETTLITIKTAYFIIKLFEELVFAILLKLAFLTVPRYIIILFYILC